MVQLNDSVSRILLQFRFSNERAIPAALMYLDQRDEDQKAKRAHLPAGTRIIDPADETSALEFLDGIIAAGYQLVGAFREERPLRSGGEGYTTPNFIFSFCFSREDEPEASFASLRDKAWHGLKQLCEQALWEVKVFRNPYVEDDQVVSGKNALSINLQRRLPLFSVDGQPLTRRPVGVLKSRAGAALPIKPAHRLCVENDQLLLVAAA